MLRRQQKLTVCWTNAMFGGKTEEAGILVSIAEHAGRTWALIRPKISKRGDESDGLLLTHMGRGFECISKTTAVEAKEAALGLVNSGIDIIWLDEIFLFPDKENIPDLVFSVLEHCEVIVSTLSRTSEGDWWPEVGEILSKADIIIDCRRAICWWCKGEATRTVYAGGEKTGKEQVGGAELYKAACVDCWNREALHYGSQTPTE